MELNYVLLHLNKKSSPGLDSIDYKIISALPPNAKDLLLNIYNRIFISHFFLSEWTRYLVFFIPKNGEGLKFRPISLASCLCKVLERMISNRLNWYLEFFNLLLNSQFGFRRSKSCIDNLAFLQSNILLSFQKNQPALAFF